MRKKVGILTIYKKNYNYGGILQAYALNKKITDMGYDCKTISYVGEKNAIYPSKIAQLEQYSKLEAIKKIKEKVFSKFKTKKFKKIFNERKKKIDDFKMNCIPNTEIYTDETLGINYRNFDYIISGSDQVWNPNTVTYAYLQQFEHDNIKKISYAASISRNALTDRDKKVMIPAIKDFDYISVREETAKKILKEEIKNHIDVVLDPTLLLDKEEWKNVESEICSVDGKYVLCYFFSNSKKYRRIISDYCKVNNLKLIYIPYAKQEFNFYDLKGKGETVDTPSIQEFIKLIDDAEYVITDSFHGAVFSIIFEKKFFVVDREKNTKVSMNSRLHDLLKKLDIKDRLVALDENSIENIDKDINYKQIKIKLNELKKDSINFLEKALESYEKKETQNINCIGENRCTGCSACYNICPTKAISMEINSEGFLYPRIDEKKCVNCGKCKISCPVINKKKIEIKPIAYAVYNKNEKCRLESSSGGVFSLIAEQILNENGVVYGAAFDDIFNVRHIKINKKEDLFKLRSSKYVQSIINETYEECKKDLNEGKKVLFTGTPCQINGLKTYLNEEYENLYTHDIICHGVPSIKVWNKYIEYREKEDCKNTNENKLVNVNFRSKKDGWNLYSVKFEYEKSIYEKNRLEDLYMQTFLSDICLRKSCYCCNFKDGNRVADITLADFWGINKVNKLIDDNKGISLMIVNSKKGNKLFELIKNKCEYKEVNLNEAITFNSSYNKASKINKNRKKYFDKLDENGFFGNYEEFVKKPIKERIVITLKKIIKKLMK